MNISKQIKYNDFPIAFFDSGVGGLTVLKQLQKLLPNEKYIYFGDTLHMPYGEKTKEQLLKYSDHIFKLFEEKNCKAVVMACNTTSSIIYDELLKKYPNFIIYPIVQTVSKSFASLDVKRIGVFATNGTINSKAYNNAISKYNNNIEVFGLACPEWVKIVEENRINTIEADIIIKQDIDKMKSFSPDKIILGCTHYPFLMNILSKYLDRSAFIDPAIYFAKSIKEDLENLNMLSTNKTRREIDVYVSSKPETFQKAAKLFYEIKRLPKIY